MATISPVNTINVECLKGRCYTSMTCVLCQRPWISWYSLPMILTKFFSHKDPNQLMEIVNTELRKLSSWFQAHKLSINKKEIILFKTKQNRQNLDLQFSINDIEIDRHSHPQSLLFFSRFHLTVTYIHITLEARTSSACPSAGQM